ncbi:family 16 glycosylhydrolase [Cellulophaga lytica]|uniref:glycoside hydrolase n=1 Tax=Cellulophaga lytica TaxID=979 RepID=UPI0032E375DD
MLKINLKYLIILIIFSGLSCSSSSDDDNTVNTAVNNDIAEETPFFIDGNSPTPLGKKWTKIENISDEFNNNSFDEAKWENTSTRWIGRAPGIFKANTVSEADGNLMLTSYELNEPEVINGDTFTHAGSNIYSKNAVQVGTYVECSMKANKTFMSSTFWLINVVGEGEGCDKRVTELDIQECVGQITGTANFAKTFDETMHSNTHSRNTACDETSVGSEGNNVTTGEKVWEDYHIYGAWWKSPTEIEFYLDGKKVYSITPKAEFNLQMYLRLVVETYDWNPVPEDGGMTGTKSERTTYYDWVRSWELKDI